MIKLILKAHKLPYPVIMTSSRDCDVMSRDQNFFMYFVTHARRLSIIQYNPHLSTVLRLAYTSYNSSMGKKRLSIIYLSYLSYLS